MRQNAIKFLYAVDCYLLYLLSGVVASLLIVAYYSLSAAMNIGGLGAQVDINSFAEYISGVLSGKASAALLLSYILVIVVTFLVFRLKKNSMSAYTGLSYVRPLSLVGSIALGFVLNVIFSLFVSAPQSTSVEVTPLLILCIILGPIVEEFMFRGVLLKMFGAAVGIIASVFITSALFAISHGNLVQAAYTFILGLVLGVVRYKSTSLWSAIALHMSFNVAGAVLAFRSFILSSSQIGILSAVAVVSLLLACTGGRKYERKKRAF